MMGMRELAMIQEPRTTMNRDNAAIRDIMHQIKERLTVPDRTTLSST